MAGLVLELGGCGTEQTRQALDTVTVSVAVGGGGSGTITSDVGDLNCGPRCTTFPVAPGAVIGLTATSDPGSTFVSWGGQCRGTTSPSCTITLGSSSVSAAAYFRRTTKMVAAGAYHTCALRPNGDVVCWGRGTDGQLGTAVASASPGTILPPASLPLIGVMNAVAIAAGGYHTCALIADGMVKCWGSNWQGALGVPTATTSTSAAPVSVPGVSDAIAVTAGGYHSCALLLNRTVKCWGLNGNGQLGDGTGQVVTVTGLGSVVSISAGGFHTCAVLRSNSNVMCWGMDNDGQLGDGTTTVSNPKPAFVRTLAGGASGPAFAARSVAASIGVGQLQQAVLGGFHTCAVGTDANVHCWGNDNEGQVTRTQTRTARPLAERQPGPAGSSLVAAGAYHVCALSAVGVTCWGHNADGERGVGAFGFNLAITSVVGTAGALHLAAGGFHTCAVLPITPTGRVACWGNNGDGQVDPSATRGLNFSAPRILLGP